MRCDLGSFGILKSHCFSCIRIVRPGGITARKARKPKAVYLSVLFILLKMSSASRSEEFADTLQGFGYGFNADGKLRKLKPNTNVLGDQGFEFNVTDSQEYNQKHYEALGEVITRYVYELLTTDGQLQKLYMPLSDKVPMEKKSFIFASKDALENPERLLILIHGSGVVRAGQWARSLIINDSLKTGTQLPYIHRARELGYGIIVMNTNDNTRTINGNTISIKNSADPIEHARYVWENFVEKSKARHIAIVAHSYGGVVVLDLANQYLTEFQKRVYGIALTDSVHSISRVSGKVGYFLQKVSRNWVSSTEPLDERVDAPSREIQRVSAGNPSHEMTSACCLGSVFRFLEEQLHEAQTDADVASPSGWSWRRLLASLLGR